MACAYAKGIVVLTADLGMFRLEAVTDGGRMIQSGNLSSFAAKGNLVGWMSGS